MKLFDLKYSRNLSLPDKLINLGHFLDHFIMLIFAKSAFDAGREFGLTYDQIIVYGTLGMFLFGAASPLAGWLADKYSRSIIITFYPFGIALGSFLCFLSTTPMMLGFSLGVIGFFAAIFHEGSVICGWCVEGRGRRWSGRFRHLKNYHTFKVSHTTAPWLTLKGKGYNNSKWSFLWIILTFLGLVALK